MQLRWALVAWLMAVEAACGGGGNKPDGGSGSTGALTVTVSGLGITAADVTVTGPNGFSQHLTATQTLSVAPGTYVVSANGVRVPGTLVDSFSDVHVSNANVVVAAAGSAGTTVAYTQRPGTGLLWVPNTDEASISGYSPAALGVGALPDGGPLPIGAGAPSASITLSFALPDGGPLYGPGLLAFDPTGRLWVAIDDRYGTGGVEQLLAYPPTALADSGTLSPAVVITPTLAGTGQLSLDYPGAMAFDRNGDLWLANSNNDALVKFASGSLGGSGSPAPALMWSTTGAPFTGIYALAFDGQGNLWVGNCAADGGSGIYEFAQSQLTSASPPTPVVSIPASSSYNTCLYALAFDSAGTLWAGECGNFRGVVGYPKGQLLDGGANGAGHDPMIAASGPFYCPSGLAFDNASNLWVTDYPDTLVGIPKSQLVDGGVVQPISAFQIPALYNGQSAFNLLPTGIPL